MPRIALIMAVHAVKLISGHSIQPGSFYQPVAVIFSSDGETKILPT
jgi:hypothetical protein